MRRGFAECVLEMRRIVEALAARFEPTALAALGAWGQPRRPTGSPSGGAAAARRRVIARCWKRPGWADWLPDSGQAPSGRHVADHLPDHLAQCFEAGWALAARHRRSTGGQPSGPDWIHAAFFDQRWALVAAARAASGLWCRTGFSRPVCGWEAWRRGLTLSTTVGVLEALVLLGGAELASALLAEQLVARAPASPSARFAGWPPAWVPWQAVIHPAKTGTALEQRPPERGELLLRYPAGFGTRHRSQNGASIHRSA